MCTTWYSSPCRSKPARGARCGHRPHRRERHLRPQPARARGRDRHQPPDADPPLRRPRGPPASRSSAAVEERQRDGARRRPPRPVAAAGDAMRLWWRHICDPSLWPNERLFFELYGQALQGRPGTTELLDGIVDAWVEPAAPMLAALRRRRAARGRAPRHRRHPRPAARPPRHRRPRGGRRGDGGLHRVYRRIYRSRRVRAGLKSANSWAAAPHRPFDAGGARAARLGARRRPKPLLRRPRWWRPRCSSAAPASAISFGTSGTTCRSPM